ncbi:MAG TPA: ATP-binding cassette domain-containing protein [Fermentimonas caenicola]|jgi:cell division transport system ATP-binding protein|uniref:Cell division ATP-binding protein FtsE n=1 Tax=Fermentimonas caenicola TaxID=1562970 RepID=A0A098C262_9BACT|nr:MULTISPECIES: ATP-binding cassette domain-containing protein [Lascolabacillus]MBP6175198.1 ATP-binding cassette domain-containing protein [Fermentimonas sp.]MDI9626400.1 ATP-binding cassette domain-containing protein [Bacteroidota bacterium]TAH61988.1 MAG: ATP-binding cassette domain-containing protein [Fermentimonas caenicola]MBP6195973.1 ATP-binding cassette domain-containing protein [Fermentimonas sp.]MBP7104539.1 ATP-binding cassette domain-containing protein [Fermentimonas sp.]
MIEEQIVNYSNVQLNREENIILRNVNLTVNRGDFLYVIGKVGSGKSTLMKSMYAELPVEYGSARVFDYELASIKRRHVPFLRRKIGIVFQDFQLLIDRTVEKNLEFVLRATDWKNKREIKDRINEVLVLVGMQNKAYKMPHELSGGEQQRVVIARALLNSPALILADEPTGNLDPETGSQIVSLLQDISGRGTAVIMSTHNYSIVQAFPGKIMRCEDMNLIPM